MKMRIHLGKKFSLNPSNRNRWQVQGPVRIIYSRAVFALVLFLLVGAPQWGWAQGFKLFEAPPVPGVSSAKASLRPSNEILKSLGAGSTGGETLIRLHPEASFIPIDWVEIKPEFKETRQWSSDSQLPTDVEPLHQVLGSRSFDLRQLPVTIQLALPRLKQWRKKSLAWNVFVDQIIKAIETLNWRHTPFKVGMLPKYYLAESVKKKYPGHELRAAVFFHSDLGAAISSHAWNDLGDYGQISVIYHEALRKIQFQSGSRLSDREVQRLAGTLALVSPSEMNAHLSDFVSGNLKQLYSRLEFIEQKSFELSQKILNFLEQNEGSINQVRSSIREEINSKLSSILELPKGLCKKLRKNESTWTNIGVARTYRQEFSNLINIYCVGSQLRENFRQVSQLIDLDKKGLQFPVYSFNAEKLYDSLEDLLWRARVGNDAASQLRSEVMESLFQYMKWAEWKKFPNETDETLHEVVQTLADMSKMFGDLSDDSWLEHTKKFLEEAPSLLDEAYWMLNTAELKNEISEVHSDAQRLSIYFFGVVRELNHADILGLNQETFDLLEIKGLRIRFSLFESLIEAYLANGENPDQAIEVFWGDETKIMMPPRNIDIIMGYLRRKMAPLQKDSTFR